MSAYVFCEECQCEVEDCEHLSHERKKEIEAGWENDLAYLDSQMYKFWLIVNAEDLGRPVPSREESDHASAELDRLLKKHHKLTRRVNCDCHTCREEGWFIPVQPNTKPRMTLMEFLEPEDGDTDASVLVSVPRAHTPLEGECTCDLCKKFFVRWPRVSRSERWQRRRNPNDIYERRRPWTEAERADWRHMGMTAMTHSRYERSFIVPETGEQVTVGNLRADEFLAEYPSALELKVNELDCL
jgi:hypothetical protein